VNGPVIILEQASEINSEILGGLKWGAARPDPKIDCSTHFAHLARGA